MSASLRQRVRKLSDAAYARTVDSLRLQYERRWYLTFSSILKLTSFEVSERYRVTGNEGAAIRAVYPVMLPLLQEAYQDMFRDVGIAFGVLALSTFIGSGQKSMMFKAADDPPTDNPSEWDIWDPWASPMMRAWMIDHIATRITGISETTRVAIRNLIIEALKEGTDSVRVAKQIQKDWAFSYERATRIVQTEITAAQNAASFYALDMFADTGTITKNWLATNDKRTRDSHMTAHYTQRDIEYNKPFIVGGAELMYPGDTSLGAPAREIVRCRCTVTYRRGTSVDNP